jgi:hypothetical protein
MKRCVTAVGVVLLFFVIALGQTNVVGRWTGALQIDESKLPKAENEEQKKQIAEALAVARKIKLDLTLKADQTYAGVTTGAPDGDVRTEGKWSVQGTTLTLTPIKRDGKAVSGQGAQPRKWTIAKDGRTISMPMPGGQGLTMVLRRRQ